METILDKDRVRAEVVIRQSAHVPGTLNLLEDQVHLSHYRNKFHISKERRAN